MELLGVFGIRAAGTRYTPSVMKLLQLRNGGSDGLLIKLVDAQLVWTLP